jgi:hypothetical protein
MKIRKILKLIELEYRGSHTAPSKQDDVSAPLHNIAGDVYPEDVYSEKAIRLYGTGINDQETFKIIKSVKDNPKKIINIYRAVPPNVNDINPGDWVSITKKYAINHKKSNGKPDWKILTKQVKVEDVITDGNSWDEWGYDPS